MDPFVYEAAVILAIQLQRNFFDIGLCLIAVSIFSGVFVMCRSLVYYLYLRIYIPGPKGTFFMGNLEQISNERTNYQDTKNQFWKKNDEQHKGIYRIVMGHQVYVVLRDLDTIFKILKKSTPKASCLLYMLYPWLGYGILTNQRLDWARSRKMIYPMLSIKGLQDYVEEFNESADTLINMWSRLPNMQVVSLRDYIDKFCLEVLINCIFHKKRKVQEKTEKSVLKYIRDLGEIQKGLVDRFCNPMHQLDIVYFRTAKGKKFRRDVEEANQFLSSLILESQMYKQGKIFTFDVKKGQNNIMEMLLLVRDKKGNILSDTVLLDEINNLVFSAFQPTAISMQYILYCMGVNLEYQESCRREILTVMRGRRDIEWSDLVNFRFFTKCVRESMRLFAPTGALCRQMDNSTVIDGHWLPPGTKVMVNVSQLHGDPRNWRDPHVFNPRRFNNGDTSKTDIPYLPFSAGPRTCIGQQFAMTKMKVLIAKILMNYRIKVLPESQMNQVNKYFLIPAEDVQIQLRRV